MKKIGWAVAGCTALGSLFIFAYHLCRPASMDNAAFLSVLGSFYSFLALIFALFAAIWARESRDIVLAYFRDYFSIGIDEREVFHRFAIISNGGEKRFSKDSFLSKMPDLKDAEYYLGTLTKKGWIEESSGELMVAADKKPLAKQLKGK